MVMDAICCYIEGLKKAQFLLHFPAFYAILYTVAKRMLT